MQYDKLFRMPKRKRSDLENSYSIIEERNKKLIEIKEKLEHLLSDYSSRFLNYYESEEFHKKVLSLEEELEKLKIFGNELKYVCEIDSNVAAQCFNLENEINGVSNKFYEFHEQLDFDSRFLYYFNFRGTKKTYYLGLYDIKARKWNKINIDFDIDTKHSESCLAQLPSSEVFYHFNSRDMTCNSSYIIDLKSFTVKRYLPNAHLLYNPSCVYYKNYIYVFGNCPSKYKALKFDLLNDKWIKFPSILENHQQYCLEIFKKSLLLVGNCEGSIFKYDFEIESYSTIDLYISAAWGSVGIISANSRAYIFESNRFLHESEIDNEYVWQKIGKFNFRFYKIPFKKYRNGSVFVTMSSGSGLKGYRFDLKSKTFKMTKDLKYY
ncbi:unnamed protein product [Blepharisma stoltei]|uniref:Uncharacterized protein n=1 Tax=Blepharisma stoltei TaxID=1481888 RepID=A0AAU9JZY5_9CILI|nr:unnamed protein product [Blepharisma stoltei]